MQIQGVMVVKSQIKMEETHKDDKDEKDENKINDKYISKRDGLKSKLFEKLYKI